jgi:hypothetical protein
MICELNMVYQFLTKMQTARERIKVQSNGFIKELYNYLKIKDLILLYHVGVKIVTVQILLNYFMNKLYDSHGGKILFTRQQL